MRLKHSGYHVSAAYILRIGVNADDARTWSSEVGSTISDHLGSAGAGELYGVAVQSRAINRTGSSLVRCLHVVGPVGGTELTRDLPGNLSLPCETLRDLHLLLLHFDVNAKPTLRASPQQLKTRLSVATSDPVLPSAHSQHRFSTQRRQLFHANLKHAHALTSHFHRMSLPHHTTSGSASSAALQGICHDSLTLLSNLIDLIGTAIAALSGLFGINTPRDDDHHPWIEPEKHCQDFASSFRKTPILSTKP
jgi:hypothetical protein